MVHIKTNKVTLVKSEKTDLLGLHCSYEEFKNYKESKGWTPKTEQTIQLCKLIRVFADQSLLISNTIAWFVLSRVGFVTCQVFTTEMIVVPLSFSAIYGPSHAKTCHRAYADSESPDQPAHPRSLIRIFANKIIGHYRIYQWRVNARMSFCACVDWIWIYAFCECSKRHFRLMRPMWRATREKDPYAICRHRRQTEKAFIRLRWRTG